MLFLYEGNMRTRLHALAAGWIPVMGELLHVPEHNFESGSQSLKSTPPPTIMLTCQKWIVTIHMASHTQHNSEPTLGRNNFPLGLLHLVLTYKCIFFYNISPCTGSRVNTIYESMCWNSFIMKFRQFFFCCFWDWYLSYVSPWLLSYYCSIMLYWECWLIGSWGLWK